MENQNEELENTSPVETEQQAPVFNQEKLNQYLESLRLEQNLPMGALVAFVTALIGAVIWAAITVSTGYQIGYMAIAIGFIVGYANRSVGKGIDQIFGIVGALFAFLGCFLGNYFSLIAFVADAEGLGYMETLGAIEIPLVLEAMAEDFGMYDILFYGLAVYEGYKFSFRQVGEDEILGNAQ